MALHEGVFSLYATRATVTAEKTKTAATRNAAARQPGTRKPKAVPAMLMCPSLAGDGSKV
ncbi:MAG: hypothetical protein ACPIOQ_76150 [Promethearchaeia archaeon]